MLVLPVTAVGCGRSESAGNGPSDAPGASTVGTVATSSARPTAPARPDSGALERTKELKFASVRSAVAYLRKRLNVPVALPTYLPAGIEFGPQAKVFQSVLRGQMKSAQLTLMMGPKRPLIIQFGQSALDGCAPEDSVAVRVHGQDALLRTAPGWVDLIWPATHQTPEGVYGLSGSLSMDQMLHMAATMPRVMARSSASMGC